MLVLAAGEGRRLRPLTWLLPKPLCPVLDRTLLDRSLDRVEALDPVRSFELVVNAHHGGAAVADHLERGGALAGWIDDGGRVRDGSASDVVPVLPSPPLAAGGRPGYSPADGAWTGDAPRTGGASGDGPRAGGAPGEGPPPEGPTTGRPTGTGAHGALPGDRPVLLSPEVGGALGTAGAIGRLVPWLDGRGVLVLNGDTFTTLDLGPLVEGWDGASHRVLVGGPEPFGAGSNVAGALVPWRAASGLAAEPSGLWESCWRDALEAGELDWVNGTGLFLDCGTPRRYLEANRAALEQAGGSGTVSWLGPGSEVTGVAIRSVVGAGAVVHGEVVDSVVWPGAVVHPGESLRSTIRTGRASNGQALSVLVR